MTPGEIKALAGLLWRETFQAASVKREPHEPGRHPTRQAERTLRERAIGNAAFFAASKMNAWRDQHGERDIPAAQSSRMIAEAIEAASETFQRQRRSQRPISGAS